MVKPRQRTDWRFLKNIKIELPSDSEIPLLGINSEQTLNPAFIAPLLTTPKTCKQLKCPLSDEWIERTHYIYTMECFSAIRNEWNNAMYGNIDGCRDYHPK